MTFSGLPDAVIDDAPIAPRRGVVSRFLHHPLGMTALAVLVLLVLVAILAPWIAPGSPTYSRLDMVNAPPGGDYLLGGDGSGRDVLSRLIYATRLTLIGALITVIVAAILGVVSGLISGYYGGAPESVGNWISNYLIVLPGTIVLVSLFSLIGPNIMVTMVVLGILIAPNFYRMVRNQVVGVKNELYIDAARVSGLRDHRIISRHVLAVVRAPIIILAATSAGLAIMVQAGLEFLGLGDASTPTWGGMLQDAFVNLYAGPHLLWPPGLAIGITVAACILFGNAVRDAVEGGAAVRRRLRPAPAATSSTVAIRTLPPDVEPDPVPIHTETIAVVVSPPVEQQLLPGQTELLSVHDLAVAYSVGGNAENEVVHGASLSVASGEILGLVGESGSGKTQIALSVLGLLPAAGQVTRGTIRVAGEDVLAMTPARLRRLRGESIGYIPQEPMSNLDPSFKIGAQLTEPMRVVRGLSAKAATARAEELLDRVGIPEPRRVMGSYPHQVSGGMAQRVLIAGSVACEPKLLIADEPTTALDVTVQAEILDLIRGLQRELGLGALLVTHNFGVVADICDRVTVMQSGMIVESGGVESTFRTPQNPYTRDLLAAGMENAPYRTSLAEELRRQGGNR